MAIGEIIKLRRYPYRKLHCEDCLYGNSQNCPTGVFKLCMEYLFPKTNT